MGYPPDPGPWRFYVTREAARVQREVTPPPYGKKLRPSLVVCRRVRDVTLPRPLGEEEKEAERGRGVGAGQEADGLGVKARAGSYTGGGRGITWPQMQLTTEPLKQCDC